MNKPILNFIFLSLLSFLIFILAIFIFSGFSFSKDISTTETLIDFMKESNNDNVLREFTFIQETIRFDDSERATDTTTWYEAIRYPNEFRIDYGPKENKNANLSRNDSIYVFRNNKLVHSGKEIQEFLILEGGIHFYSTQEAIEKLERLGVNTKIFTTSNYKGRAVYIIGAKEGDLSVPQIWLDKEFFYSVRRISKSARSGNLYEVKYDDYRNFDGHWIETWIEFYRDGKLLQTERYNNIDINPNLDDKVFDPEFFGEYYWF